MRKIIGIILFLCVFTWDIAMDFHKWKTGVDVNHAWEAILRMILLIPAVWFLSFNSIKAPKDWFWRVTATILLLGSFWLLFFDGIYNVLRGFNWWFNGSVDGGDSRLDLILMRLKDWQEATIKIGLLTISLIFYILKNSRT